MSEKKDDTQNSGKYENRLPDWWVWLFGLSIAFAGGGMVWYHVLNKSDLTAEPTPDQKDPSLIMTLANSVPRSMDELANLAKDPQRVEEGKGLFIANCASCHGHLGEGTVGPNLTDRFWIHGGTPDQVLSTIMDGIPSQGMVAWGPILGQQKAESVLAYVLSLKDSNPPNAKPPEGDAY